MSDCSVVVSFFHMLLLNGQMTFTSYSEILLLDSQHFVANICHHFCFSFTFYPIHFQKGQQQFLFSLLLMKKIMFLLYPSCFYYKSTYDKYSGGNKFFIKRSRNPQRQMFITDDTTLQKLISSLFLYSHNRDGGSGNLNYSLNITTHSCINNVMCLLDLQLSFVNKHTFSEVFLRQGSGDLWRNKSLPGEKSCLDSGINNIKFTGIICLFSHLNLLILSKK